MRLFSKKPNVKSILKEFKELKKYNHHGSCDVGSLQDNRKRNRYSNILPYDQTRVKLEGDHDYINANKITFKGFEHKFNYIATQGPLEDTRDDFWEMVWEQKVRTIVMLTGEREGGREKCARYWPTASNADSTLVFWDVSVRLVHIEHSRGDRDHDYDIREFAVTHTKLQETRIVKQFYYKSWPDFGVPHSDTALDGLIAAVRAWNDHDKNPSDPPLPTVVHCSAGVGRTGTYMIVDFGRYLQQENEPTDRILDWVKELRECRAGMVQSEEQYLWCYFALGKVDAAAMKELDHNRFS